MNGTTWSALVSGVNDVVRCFGIFNSELYVGGDFTSAGGNSANYVSKWDGTAWSSLGTGTDDAVWALQEYNGELFVGGTFSNAGTATSTIRIAKWNGTTWSVVGSSLNNTVFALAVYNGELYAGGFFTTIWATSTPANRIAKWNGTMWSVVGTGLDGGVFDLYGTTSALYIGGAFTTAGASVTVNGITALGTTVGIEEQSDDLSINVFPNPANTLIQITSNRVTEIERIVLTSTDGKLNKQFEKRSDTWILDVSQLAKGNYFVLVRGKDNAVHTKKLLIY